MQYMDIFIVKGYFNNKCNNITTCIVFCTPDELIKFGKVLVAFDQTISPEVYHSITLKPFLRGEVISPNCCHLTSP